MNRLFAVVQFMSQLFPSLPFNPVNNIYRLLFLRMFLTRINMLPLTSQCTNTRPHTTTQLFHLCRSPMLKPKYKWINVVLNLAYYNRSANASWVNRCPGHPSSHRKNTGAVASFADGCTHESMREHTADHMPCTFWAVVTGVYKQIMRFYLALCFCGAEIAAGYNRSVLGWCR